MAEASPECRARRKWLPPSDQEQSLVFWQSCRELCPGQLTKGCFRERAARNREFEGPSQQCSSQIPLRCVSRRFPAKYRLTSDVQADFRQISNRRFALMTNPTGWHPSSAAFLFQKRRPSVAKSVLSVGRFRCTRTGNLSLRAS